MAGAGGAGQDNTPPWSPLRQPPRTWRGPLKAGHVDRSLAVLPRMLRAPRLFISLSSEFIQNPLAWALIPCEK